MSDLKVYCTKDFYNRYLLTGHLIGCSPATRNDLLFENREKHEDLSVRLSIDVRKHSIINIDKEWMGGREVEGSWYQIVRN